VPDASKGEVRTIASLKKRLTQLIETPWDNGEAKRLVKRLRRHRNEFLKASAKSRQVRNLNVGMGIHGKSSVFFVI